MRDGEIAILTWLLKLKKTMKYSEGPRALEIVIPNVDGKVLKERKRKSLKDKLCSTKTNSMV